MGDKIELDAAGIEAIVQAVRPYTRQTLFVDEHRKIVMDAILSASKAVAKEPGELSQELGGVGVTLLALAAAANVSADDAELTEIRRVLSKPLEHFWARNKVKNDAGFNALAYPSAPPPAAKEAE